MNPEDSITKRREKMRKDFEEFLNNFEDPKNSDVLVEKKTKEDKRPRA